MFKCSITNKSSLPGEKPIIVVTKKRKKTYDNGTSFGWEIVEELRMTPEGHSIWITSNKESVAS